MEASLSTKRWSESPGAGQGLCLVTAEIVEDDDDYRPQDWKKQLLDIGAEAQPIDRAVEDAGRGEAVPAQGAEEGQSPELMQGQVRRLVDPLADEGTVGIQHRLAMTADLAWRHRARRRFVC